jgi:uncharacterized protein YegL
MNDNLVDVTVILDRSGSMATIANDTNGGLQSFIDEQKKVHDKNIKLTLVQFDDEYEVVYDRVDIREVKKHTLQPRGSTALLDAIGKTINAKGAEFRRMKEENRPGKVIFVIITDGEENSSHEFAAPGLIKEMIEHQKDKYNWDFIYLGANQDAVTVGRSMGVSAASCASYAHTGQGITRGMVMTSQKLASYVGSNNKADLCYSQDERNELQG